MATQYFFSSKFLTVFLIQITCQFLDCSKDQRAFPLHSYLLVFIMLHPQIPLKYLPKVSPRFLKLSSFTCFKVQQRFSVPLLNGRWTHCPKPLLFTCFKLQRRLYFSSVQILDILLQFVYFYSIFRLYPASLQSLWYLSGYLESVPIVYRKKIS